MPSFAVSTVFKAKDGVSAVFGKMGKQAGFFGDNADKAFRKASRSGSRFGDIVKGILVTDVIRGGLRALRDGLRAVTTEFIDYDAAIVSASAKFKGLNLNTQEGIKTLEALKQTARDVGASTEFSATQAASGLEFLAVAGFNAEQAMSALPGVVDLATAGKVDLARATDIASDSLGAFGLMTKDTAQLTLNLARVNDVFAKATTTANTNMEQLFEAVSEGGVQFTATGQSMETFSALAGVMADSTIKGGRAGTVLRNVMLRLSNATPAATKVIDKLGVKIKDGDGNFRDIIDILADFETGLKKMNGTVDKSAALAEVFGARAVGGVNILLQKGTKELRVYRDSLIDSAGASKTMADIIRQSIGNQLKGLNSALIELGFQFFDTFKNKIGPAITSLTEFVRGINIPAMIASFNSLLDTLRPFRGVILGIAAAFVTYNAVFIAFALASKIKTFLAFAAALRTVGIAQGLLNIVMMANPIGLVAAAVGLLVAGLVLLFDNWDAVVKAFKSGFGIFDAVANFFGDDEVEVKKTVDIATRQAPNTANIAAQQVQFNGQLNIAGAPEGSTVSGETKGAPPVRIELAGANP